MLVPPDASISSRYSSVISSPSTARSPPLPEDTSCTEPEKVEAAGSSSSSVMSKPPGLLSLLTCTVTLSVMVSSVLRSQSTTVMATVEPGWNAAPPNPAMPVELHAIGFGLATRAYSCGPTGTEWPTICTRQAPGIGLSTETCSMLLMRSSPLRVAGALGFAGSIVQGKTRLPAGSVTTRSRSLTSAKTGSGDAGSSSHASVMRRRSSPGCTMTRCSPVPPSPTSDCRTPPARSESIACFVRTVPKPYWQSGPGLPRSSPEFARSALSAAFERSASSGYCWRQS